MRAFVLALFFSVVVLRFLLSFRTRELSFFFAFLLSLARTFASSDLAFRLTSWRWKRELRALERSPRVFSSVRRASSRAFVASEFLTSFSLSLFFCFFSFVNTRKRGRRRIKVQRKGVFSPLVTSCMFVERPFNVAFRHTWHIYMRRRRKLGVRREWSLATGQRVVRMEP